MVSRDALLRNAVILRNLFGLLQLNVTTFPDDALVDATLTVCPIVCDDWPSDAQLQAVVELLQHQALRSN